MDNPVDKYMRDCVYLWSKMLRPSLKDQIIILGKIQGDLCKILRDREESEPIELNESYRELANIALSSLRFVSYSVTLPVEEILESAYQSQKDYIEHGR